MDLQKAQIDQESCVHGFGHSLGGATDMLEANERCIRYAFILQGTRRKRATEQSDCVCRRADNRAFSVSPAQSQTRVEETHAHDHLTWCRRVAGELRTTEL